MKNILVLSLIIFGFQQAQSQKIDWIPFHWVGENIDGKYFDKLLITIPVSLDNLPHKFNMQFDLGATVTVIYGNSIEPYLEKYPEFKTKFDTTLKFRIQSQTNFKFKNIGLKLGSVSFGNRNIGNFKGFGDEISSDSIKTISSKHIGTIAPDLFQDKILIIDYLNKRIAVTQTLPKQFANASFQKYKEKDGRIKIPLNINGKIEDLMFDTGSSLFSLITTESNANLISTKPTIDSLKISSWGDFYMVYGQKVNTIIKFGTKSLNPTLVFFDKLHKSDKFYEEEKIWGITGNAYFLNNVVIIDYKNKRFGVK
jgi:hypothetical protein